MYEISVKTHFSAAHHLRGYRGTCADIHGHNWEVEVFIRGERLDRDGFLVDFRKIKADLRESLKDFDHRDLNALPAFSKENPTSENLARHLHRVLSRRIRIGGCRVSRVLVSEAPGTRATYEPRGSRGR
jgi:6-pyruvoyltetrahydropterin/6-carboxytetrahydropterin synthase